MIYLVRAHLAGLIHSSWVWLCWVAYASSVNEAINHTPVYKQCVWQQAGGLLLLFNSDSEIKPPCTKKAIRPISCVEIRNVFFNTMSSYIHNLTQKYDMFNTRRKTFGRSLLSTPHSQIDTGTFKADHSVYIYSTGKKKFLHLPSAKLLISETRSLLQWVTASSSPPQNISLLYAGGNNCTWGRWYFPLFSLRTTAPTSTSLVETSGLSCHCRHAEFLQPFLCLTLTQTCT